MNKSAFLHELRARLYQLGEEERARSVRYYSELIGDMMEDGYSEEEAVEKLGGPAQVAEQVLCEVGMPAPTEAEAPAGEAPPPYLPPTGRPDTDRVAPSFGHVRSGKRQWSTAAIIFAVVGSPIWVPLLIAAAAVVLSLFLVLWVLVLVIFVVAVAVLVSSLALVAAAILRATSFGEAAMLLGVALFCTGFAILVFVCGIYAARGVAWLTARAARGFRAKKQKEG